MNEIHVLDNSTIDQIAAGEVVERPSSVVKELVENAIDAGAEHITVEIKEGGTTLIRVTDDGCGIAKSQLRKVFLRHATSKIKEIADLDTVMSLGFRGEALSSIAAVCQVELITKTKDELTGTRVCINGSQMEEPEEVGAPDGTTIIARNIFFNTPVRKKFLKSAQTEGTYIADLMQHIALSSPDVAIQFIANGSTKFYTSGNGDVKEIIYRIYGRDVAQQCLFFENKMEGVHLYGYLGKPVLNRANRGFETFFVNSRYIRNGQIALAVEEGYKTFLMQHKYPFVVLYFEIDPTKIDVNVHPTKMDIRIHEPMEFLAFVRDAVKEGLSGKSLISSGEIKPFAKQADEEKAEGGQEGAQQTRLPQPFEKKRMLAEKSRYMSGKLAEANRDGKGAFENRLEGISSDSENTAEKRLAGINRDDENAVDKELAATNSDKNNTANQLAAGDGSVGKLNTDGKSETGADLPAGDKSETGAEAPTDGKMKNQALYDAIMQKPAEEREKRVIGAAKQTAIGGQTGMPFSGNVIKQRNTILIEKPEQLSLFDQEDEALLAEGEFRIIGQMFDTYWILTYGSKLYYVDQHAAHEKVMYEKLMKHYREKEILTQALAVPIAVNVTPKEDSVIKKHREIFETLGFELDDFGENSYALRTVPMDLYGMTEKEQFLMILDELVESPVKEDNSGILDKIASMACKAAVKGNQQLSMREAEELMKQLFACENPYNCPHGRPTIISMTRSELEKKFKRTL